MADPPPDATALVVGNVIEPVLNPEAIPLPDSDNESNADIDAGDDAAPTLAQAVRRSSIEKRPITVPDNDEDEPDSIAVGEKGFKSRNTTFERLPDEIIQQCATSFPFPLTLTRASHSGAIPLQVGRAPANASATAITESYN